LSSPESGPEAGWILHEFETVDSTNDQARDLPAWHAVRADAQRRGRGRFGRVWESSRGGLWLSAVLPAEGPVEAVRMTPLIAALSVLRALEAFHLPRLRLRWPNDIMADERKLAGLLVERMEAGRPVVGIGLNVTNVFSGDPALGALATSLAAFVDPVPGLGLLTASILDNLRREFVETCARGVAPMLKALDPFWGEPRAVMLDLDGVEQRGVFEGVDLSGRLRLRTDDGQRLFDAREVRQLKELRS
jgi:BirA family biotin operon repressor/biotin-[acetyl-CoA-carboxylase] ligase